MKEVIQKKQDVKLENIDIRIIRKQFAKIEKSFQTINETLETHTTIFKSVLPKAKAPKLNKKKRPKKKVKNTDEDESFLDSVLEQDKKEEERRLEEIRKEEEHKIEEERKEKERLIAEQKKEEERRIEVQNAIKREIEAKQMLKLQKETENVIAG